MKTWLGIICVATAGLVGTLVIVPLILPPRTESSQSACTSNLEYLKRLKQEWAAKDGKTADAKPTEEDLFGASWTNRMPGCPAGGIYRIGTLSENPTCSLGGPAHSVRAN